MFPALDISTSGLAAQRIRMNAQSSNIANISTTHNERGEPEAYQPRFVVFQTDESVGAHGAAGVRVASVEIADVEPIWRYEPHHPDAVKEGPHAGYVAYPNVNMMTEFTDALEAARAYEANLGVIDITKDMQNQTLRILA
ncbi:MAG: flagellar basal body rod protein FlgC [Thermoguttaceae bacterium]|jgi:flagellar basal-body rod protein FlgC|nr:flagellar basal body rod protein FlgC [Thermoguttaceae bacterium]